MKVCVVGTGYVGLVTGTCLADLGNTVVCIDNDPKKLEILRQDKVPFYEEGLAEKIERSRSAGRLSFSDDLKTAVLDASLIFVAVGTPALPNGRANMSAVFSVVDSVVSILKENPSNELRVLITKSTVPVGTGKSIIERRDEAGISDDVLAVASNPEFLREGSAVYDFFHPDRIVIGSSNSKALDMLAELYNPLYLRETPIVRTDLETAELSKYASNAFLATKISFINEMANLCESLGADAKDVAKIMGMDGRIGKYFLHPGPGYGGSCFPKDTQSLINIAADVDYDLKVVKAVEEVNVIQKQRVMEQVNRYFGSELSGKTFAILGLAFKPNTDDVRDASSRVIIQCLLDQGASVRCFDPEVKALPEFESNSSVVMCENSYDAAEGTDAVLLVTEWHAFRELNLEKLKSSMKESVFFDLRNVYSPEKLAAAGFDAYVIGRQVIKAKALS